MAVIVDATIQGKLDKPIMPNVASSNDRTDFTRGTSGVTKTTTKNVLKLSAERGVPIVSAEAVGTLSGMKQAQQIGKEITVSISEGSKGTNIDAFA